jgi:hypothetical protein
MVSMASGSPEIVGQGKGVTSASIARLMDPKRAPRLPMLNPNYKVPKQYAGIAQALGVDTRNYKVPKQSAGLVQSFDTGTKEGE